MPIEFNAEAARSALAAKRITQTTLAKSVGVNRQSMCRILAGTQRPSEKTARRIAEMLGVEFEQIIEVADGMYVLTEMEATLLKLFRRLSMIDKADTLTAVNKKVTASEVASAVGSSPASSP